MPALLLSNSWRQPDAQESMFFGMVGYLVEANLSLQALNERVGQLRED